MACQQSKVASCPVANLSLNLYRCARREQALQTVVLQRAGNHEVDVISGRRIGEEVLEVAPFEVNAICSTIERWRAKNRGGALRLYVAG